jgi:hypothetical protein
VNVPEHPVPQWRHKVFPGWILLLSMVFAGAIKLVQWTLRYREGDWLHFAAGAATGPYVVARRRPGTLLPFLNSSILPLAASSTEQYLGSVQHTLKHVLCAGPHQLPAPKSL